MAWSKSTRIIVMLVIDVAFFLLELGVGLIVGSLALMADAFHMLNDIISLLVGLWAVKAAQRSSSDKYSFGWLRAEILGAFFNAVFLIALCFSILLEAITRLIDPPEISNPMLILIVGSLGLASNLAGFFVLGGHGHSHGAEEHEAEHKHSQVQGDKIRTAEEGYSRGENRHTHDVADEFGRIGDILPEAVVARATLTSPDSARHLRFTRSDETASTSKGSEHSNARSATKSSRRHRRRTSSIRANRLSNIDDLSIHPASFRQEIIAASRTSLDGIQSDEGSECEEAVAEDTDMVTETSPLINKATNGNTTKRSHDHCHGHPIDESPRSWHADHNHNKPKRSGKSSGHNHADMGMRAMILHVIGDALGNVGVIASALIIWLTPWSGRFYADPAVSLFITIIILHSTLPLTAATAKILLQATPDHIDVKDIKEDIEDIPGVVSCHHVHIWQLSDSQIIASMHVQLEFPLKEGGQERYMEVAKEVRECLHAYGIHSATIQPEFCLDKAHKHIETGAPGFDGPSTRKTDDAASCLLECVDDCGKGCCSAPNNTGLGQDHSDHSGHNH